MNKSRAKLQLGTNVDAAMHLQVYVYDLSLSFTSHVLVYSSALMDDGGGTLKHVRPLKTLKCMSETKEATR